LSIFNATFCVISFFKLSLVIKIPFFILFILGGLSDLNAQDFYPRYLRQSIHGQVFLEIPLQDPCMQIKSLPLPDGTKKIFNLVSYKVSSDKDTTINSDQAWAFDYLTHGFADPETFTDRSFPLTLIRNGEFEKINERSYKITDSSHKGVHVLNLDYNKLGGLIKITEIFKRSDQITTIKWIYQYLDNKIKKITNGTNSTIYLYDINGQLVSEICYLGKSFERTAYLNADSLNESYRKKQRTNEISKLLNTSNCKILQVTFYKHAGEQTKEIIFFDRENLGVKKLNIAYDNLKRISFVKDGATELSYVYGQDNRLRKSVTQQNTDANKSGKPISESIDKFYYNKSGVLSRIEHETEANSDILSSGFILKYK